MQQLNFPDSTRLAMQEKLREVGLCDPWELETLARDFVDRPEVFASLLQTDFGLDPISAHHTRAAVMNMLSQSTEDQEKNGLAQKPKSTTDIRNGMQPQSSFEAESKQDVASPDRPLDKSVVSKSTKTREKIEVSKDAMDIRNGKQQVGRFEGESRQDEASHDELERPLNISVIPESTGTHEKNDLIKVSKDTLGIRNGKQQDRSFEAVIIQDGMSQEERKKPLYKSVVVNEKAKRRKSPSNEKHDYGLPRNYRELYPVLAKELNNFFSFMTRPSTASQEPSIKPATANVYLRHAKLFLGWYISQVKKDEEGSTFDASNASIFTIVTTKEKESADCLLEFILWLRTSRSISVSYEANVLRGLTKLLKFRFAAQSKADPSYGEKSFDDIPVIRELRKLHRDANKRQTLSPRSSDEDRKWLSWPEYLQVIHALKKDLLQLMDNEEAETPKRKNTNKPTSSQRTLATVYQQYLILSFLACVPDRQRTIRELELKRSFIRDVQNGFWTIKHGPDDYKTGKTYGDRPPLVLSPELVPAIDDFLERWRPCLMPKSNHLFIQPRTGNPLTQDSVYQAVARSCYKYSGKRTNPHLLRDMIVTHVRESDASEKQLEALALYMGHSIQMQRTSYDRRTLTKKVAPAVELLKSINKLDGDE
jgi:integrase